MAFRRACCALAFVLAAALLATGLRAQQPTQVPGAIRTGITMVPIDVRVIDRHRQPVTDLSESDFTILENGVPQSIRHFSTSALTPAAPARDARPVFRSADAAGAVTAPRDNRVFLLVLGRGRLQVPAKGLDGLISLVRERVLPQDQVAVLAYNRATDFTADHERIVRVLERYKEANPALDTRLASHFSGLQAEYGSRAIPAYIQDAIDDVFEDADAPEYRRLPTSRIADEPRLREDFRRGDEGARAPIADLAEIGGPSVSGFARARTTQDLESLYTGIEYLRHLEGEKHLIFLTESGLLLPRVEHDFSLAALASDARVVVNTIHTGGIGAPPSPFSLSPFRKFGPSAPAIPGRSWQEFVGTRSLANIARFTGGLSAAYVYADRAAGRIDTATRFQYLLAYEPSNPEQDGRFRRITVTVDRPGLTVLYRHGYYAHEQLVPFDRRQFMTYSRIATAGYYTENIHDIELALEVTPPARNAGEVGLELTIDTSRLRFERVGDRHVAALEVAIFAGDRRQHLVGELWQKLDLKLTGESFARAAKEGFRHAATVPVSARPRYVKAVVYDPAGDVLGSTVQRIR